MNNRQEDSTSLFEFLNNELSVPCLAYDVGFVRTINAIMSDIKLDVYIDGRLIAQDLGYRQFSYYIPMPPAISHNVRVYISGEPNKPIIDTQTEIHQANVETLVIVGTPENPSVFSVVGNPTQQLLPARGVIRYANLTNEDIQLEVLRGNETIEEMILKHGEYNKYTPIEAGEYRFKFALKNPTGTVTELYRTFEIKPTRIYTVYLFGSLDMTSPIYSNYPLEPKVSVDIATIIKKCPPNLKKAE